MKNTKLIRLLGALSHNEMKRLNEFISSPYHNKNAKIKSLFENIRKYYPDFENRNFTKEKLYKKVFSGSYNSAQFRSVVSDLYELVKNFLSAETLKKDPFTSSVYMLEFLITRNSAAPVLDTEVKKVYADLEKMPFSLQYFRTRFELEGLMTRHYSNTSSDKKFPEQAKIEVEYLMNLFSIHLFDTLSVFNNGGHAFDFTINNKPLEEIAELLKKYGYINHPAVIIYYHIYRLYKFNDEKDYLILTEMKNRHEHRLEWEMQYFLYQVLELFLQKKVLKGEEKHYYPLFELYKHAFENNIYITPQTIFPVKVTGAIDAALRTGEQDWAQKFLDGLEERLVKENYTDYLNFYRARVLSASGRNEEALEFLNRLKTKDTLLKNGAKNMMLRVLYEMGHYETALSMIDAYKHFIRREKSFSKIHKESVLNFIKSIEKLIKITLSFEKHEVEELKRDLMNNKSSLSFQWLMQKIKLVENGKDRTE